LSSTTSRFITSILIFLVAAWLGTSIFTFVEVMFGSWDPVFLILLGFVIPLFLVVWFVVSRLIKRDAKRPPI